MIPRTIADKVRSDAAGFPIVAVLGPRQSGKSTLVTSIFDDYAYRNLEDPSVRQFAEEDPKAMLQSGESGMIIDEFQRVPNLVSHIQVFSDARDRPGQLILTGSQNFLMMERISQSLAGRVSILTLLPFSLGELHAVDLGSLEDVLFRGLYPRLYSADINPRRFYESYIRTYLERDVRSIRDVGDLSTFQRFLRVCAGRVGQIVNYSSIGDDLGLSHNTVRAWMSVLEASYVVRLLRPFHRNFGKQTTKSPRLYFVDTGLVCALLEIDSSGSLRNHHLRGAIFENLVVNEIAKAFVNEAKREPLSYWRDRRGNEVDLLVEKAENRVAVEAKAGMTIAGTWFRGLSYYGNLDPACPPENRYVVYGGEEGQKRSSGEVVSWRDLAAFASSLTTDRY